MPNQTERCSVPKITTVQKYGWLVGWLDFMAYQPFYTNHQFYFKQFSLAQIHSLIVKNISISTFSVYSNSSDSANYV